LLSLLNELSLLLLLLLLVLPPLVYPPVRIRLSRCSIPIDLKSCTLPPPSAVAVSPPTTVSETPSGTEMVAFTTTCPFQLTWTSLDSHEVNRVMRL
jgi:hypothetical protein